MVNPIEYRSPLASYPLSTPLKLSGTNNEKAGTQKGFFSALFTHENLSNLPSSKQHFQGLELGGIPIITETVRKKLLALKSSKPAGLDYIPPRCLKETANVIAEPPQMIFQKSLNEWGSSTGLGNG